MTKKIPEYLAKAARPAINEDKLRKLRGLVAEVRDLELSKRQGEERLKETSKALLKLTMETLPDFMDEVGVQSISLDAEGNYPPFEAKLEPFIKANIAVSWDEERRAAAFEWLEANGHGDLIKTQYVIELPCEEREKANELEIALAKLGVVFDCSLEVPWQTLSAWLRERVNSHDIPPLELIGGQIGRCVKLKRKD